eukprot:5712212-Amphidinium_carterae.2
MEQSRTLSLLHFQALLAETCTPKVEHAQVQVQEGDAVKTPLLMKTGGKRLAFRATLGDKPQRREELGPKFRV